ncbi:MAG: site-2 protease family protein [Patescibacteria group bacterium]
MTTVDGDISVFKKLADKTFRLFFRQECKTVFFSIVSIVAFFMFMALLFDPTYAVSITICLLTHELGHLWAMKRCGVKIHNLYFIPGVGAIAETKKDFDSYSDEAFSVIMGPVWGTICGIVAFTLFAWTGRPEFIGAAWICVILNLVNLLPVAPLDGGRVVRAALYGISRSWTIWLMATLFVISLVAAYWFSLSPVIYVFVCLFGLSDLISFRAQAQLDDDWWRIARISQGKYRQTFKELDENIERLKRCRSVATDSPELQAAYDSLAIWNQLLAEAAELRKPRRTWQFWRKKKYVTPDDIFTTIQKFMFHLEVFMPKSRLSIKLSSGYLTGYVCLILVLICLAMVCSSAMPFADWFQSVAG